VRRELRDSFRRGLQILVLDDEQWWHHDAFMRTTINISDAILNELRERARQRRRPFREILEETIQRGLGAPPSTSGERVRIQTHRVGIKPAYQGLSLNQLYDQIEAEDAGKR
jgi:hypothetical protein